VRQARAGLRRSSESWRSGRTGRLAAGAFGRTRASVFRRDGVAKDPMDSATASPPLFSPGNIAATIHTEFETLEDTSPLAPNTLEDRLPPRA
jgi:hypothetical protein